MSVETRIQRHVWALWAAGLTSLAIGCASDDGRVAVDGTVTVDGQPLENGTINFQPAPGNQAPSSGSAIRQGNFALATARGLQPGEYLVTVHAFRKSGRTINDPQMGQVEEIVPVKFQETMPLKASVTAGAENHLEFSLTSVPH